MEDMGQLSVADGGRLCSRPVLNETDRSNIHGGPDKYATKHNPFAYFHAIIDDDVE